MELNKQMNQLENIKLIEKKYILTQRVIITGVCGLENA